MSCDRINLGIVLQDRLTASVMFVYFTFTLQYTGMDGSHFHQHEKDVVNKDE